MSSAVSTSEGLLSAEQFAALPPSRRPQELIAGKVVDMPSPGTPHGQVIFNIAFLLKTYLKKNDIGRAWGAESGLVTIRQPDSVRGMDAAFCSYQRWPKNESKKGLMEVAPELVIEVISPEDRWPRVLKKITEYFDSGVLVVCTIDPEVRMVQIHMDASSSTVLRSDDVFEVPMVLPEFSCQVSEFFEGV
jgi:Uma2 family endonuclease